MIHEITISVDDEEDTIEVTGNLQGISTSDLACALTELIRILDREYEGRLINLMAAAAEAMKNE